jgi:uncharacterized membrane protein
MEESNQTPPKGDNKTLMGALAYLGPLVIIPYLTAKDDAFVKFHIKQGLVLLVIEAIIWILGMWVWMLWPILQLVNLATIILAILGIVNVVNKKQQELPVVGKFASHFTF